jgi:hypothetical protein
MGSGFGSDAFSTPTVLSLRIKLLRCPMCPPGLLSCRPSCGAWDGCLVREQGPEGLWGLQVRLGGVPGPRCGEGGASDAGHRQRLGQGWKRVPWKDPVTSSTISKHSRKKTHVLFTNHSRGL